MLDTQCSMIAMPLAMHLPFKFLVLSAAWQLQSATTMKNLASAAFCLSGILATSGADFVPGPQHFRQELAHSFSGDLPAAKIQLVETTSNNLVRAFADGKWYELKSGRFQVVAESPNDNAFVLLDGVGRRVQVPVPWREVRQILRAGSNAYIASVHALLAVSDQQPLPIDWPADRNINQIAIS